MTERTFAIGNRVTKRKGSRVVNDRGMFVAMWDADWSTEPDERYPHLGRGWFMVGDGKDIARPLRSDYPRLWAPLPTVPAIEPESEK